jgi:hypothetical protein
VLGFHANRTWYPYFTHVQSLVIDKVSSKTGCNNLVWDDTTGKVHLDNSSSNSPWESGTGTNSVEVIASPQSYLASGDGALAGGYFYTGVHVYADGLGSFNYSTAKNIDSNTMGEGSAILGGLDNYIDKSLSSIILGGNHNIIDTTHPRSTIINSRNVKIQTGNAVAINRTTSTPLTVDGTHISQDVYLPDLTLTTKSYKPVVVNTTSGKLFYKTPTPNMAEIYIKTPCLLNQNNFEIQNDCQKNVVVHSDATKSQGFIGAISPIKHVYGSTDRPNTYITISAQLSVECDDESFRESGGVTYIPVVLFIYDEKASDETNVQAKFQLKEREVTNVSLTALVLTDNLGDFDFSLRIKSQWTSNPGTETVTAYWQTTHLTVFE